MRKLITTLTATLTGAASAHDGHGLAGTHWHPTDIWGFIALAAVVALVIWQARK